MTKESEESIPRRVSRIEMWENKLNNPFDPGPWLWHRRCLPGGAARRNRE
jgi:hypothetical protein